MLLRIVRPGSLGLALVLLLLLSGHPGTTYE